MIMKIMEKIIFQKNKKIIYACFSFINFLAFAGLLFQFIRGFKDMDPSWTLSTGIEILGIAICAVVFFSCIQSVESVEDHIAVFIPQLLVCALTLFFDEMAWLVQDLPDYHYVNCVVNSLLHVSYHALSLLFWMYIQKTLGVKNKFIDITNWVFIIGFYIYSIVNILDIFFPIFFTVDSNGTYSRTSLYDLKWTLYIVIIPAYIYCLFKSKVPKKAKIVSGSLYLLPILAEIVTRFKFGISLKPASLLLAIILNYGVLVAEREKRIAVTRHELGIASQIQMNLLPNIFPAFPDRKDFDVFAMTVPAKEVGGDFYDFFMVDDKHLAILMADVSDKGIGAALFMTISKIIIKTRAQLGGTPSEIIEYADRRINEKNDAGLFVTVWLGIIDLETGHIECCNAGHDYPAIMNSSDGYKIEKDIHGMPVAFMPEAKFPGYSFDLKDGDRIFLYTDGILDAKKINGERYEKERLLEVLNKNRYKSDEQLIRIVRASVTAYFGDEPQFDDMTMLSFTYHGAKTVEQN